MDFIKSKHSSARDIALAFGVPPQLLDVPGDNTYSNLVEARLSLWEQRMLPTVENIICHINFWLVPKFGKHLSLSYDKYRDRDSNGEKTKDVEIRAKSKLHDAQWKKRRF